MGVLSEKSVASLGAPDNANPVPSRAKATWIPIASAISLPVNHLTTTFDTVIPHNS